MALELLEPSVQESSEELGRRFADAKPFRHIVIDDFFTPGFCNELIEGFPAFDPARALNEFGEVGGKAVVPQIARIAPAYARLDALLRDRVFLAWLERTTGIEGLLYDPDYVGGGTHENLDGQELDPHVDFNLHPRLGWHRRLNLIVFLNREWEQIWGGCLELHQDPWRSGPAGERVRVLPRANRAVLFETTESSWHGFERISLPPEKQSISRRSVAVYFYTRERPADQIVPEHGTYYAPRPLPERLQAGWTLTREDVEELQRLLTRRDGQLRYFWGRERQLRNYIERLHRSPSLRLGMALTWPLRKLRDKLQSTG